MTIKFANKGHDSRNNPGFKLGPNSAAGHLMAENRSQIDVIPAMALGSGAISPVFPSVHSPRLPGQATRDNPECKAATDSRPEPSSFIHGYVLRQRGRVDGGG